MWRGGGFPKSFERLLSASSYSGLVSSYAKGDGILIRMTNNQDEKTAKSVRRYALALALFTVAYNLGEGVIAMVAAMASGSTALLGCRADLSLSVAPFCDQIEAMLLSFWMGPA